MESATSSPSPPLLTQHTKTRSHAGEIEHAVIAGVVPPMVQPRAHSVLSDSRTLGVGSSAGWAAFLVRIRDPLPVSIRSDSPKRPQLEVAAPERLAPLKLLYLIKDSRKDFVRWIATAILQLKNPA